MESVEKRMETATRDLLGKRSVVFVGLMGVGKTAVGRRVAQMCGIDFIDSDHEIEYISTMTIPELFENYGESEFRSLESRVIQRVLEGGPQVVSTGGGAFMNEATQAAIRDNAISIWLKADLDLMMERVSRRKNRPLLQDPDPRGVMNRLMVQRYPVYQKADITVQSEDISKDDMARKVIGILNGYLQNDGVISGNGK